MTISNRFFLHFIGILLSAGILTASCSGSATSSGVQQDSFTDRSQLRKGDYIYNDGEYFSHSPLPAITPFARVINDGPCPQALTLNPIAVCKSEDIANYLSAFSNKHSRVMIPSVNQWVMISKDIYNLQVEQGQQRCPYLYNGIGFSHFIPQFTLYKELSPTTRTAGGIEMMKEFRCGSVKEAWCSDTHIIDGKHHQQTFFPGLGNTAGCSSDANKLANLYLIYDL